MLEKGSFNELLFRDVLDFVNEVVIVVEKDTGNVLLWNLAAEDMYGYTKDEILGKSINTIIPDGYTAAPRREDVFESDISESFKSVRQGKNGDLQVVEIELHPLRNKIGKLAAVLGIHCFA